MDPKILFTLSAQALSSVIDQIKSEQWDRPMPADFQTWASQPQTLREVVNGHVSDDAWIPDMLAGRTIAEAGDQYKGDLLGDQPLTRAHEATAAALTAVQASDLKAIAHLSYGDTPVHEYLLHMTCYKTFRAVDLARFIGVSDKLPPELVSGLTEILQPRLEEFRAAGIFPAPLPVSEDMSAQDRLLALAGRAASAHQ